MTSASSSSDSTAREIEFKLLVSGPEALDAIAAAAEARGAAAAAPARQVNHFFDTPAGDLRGRGTIVRLRDEDGTWTLCAKGPVGPEAREPGELHVRVEVEHELDASAARAIQAGGDDPLRRLEAALGSQPLLESMRATVGHTALVAAGTFENQRTRVGPLDVGGRSLFLELDRTSFPGDTTHCEVEFEVPAGLEDRAGALLRELLAAAGTEGRPAPSKSDRFFRALDGQPI